VAAKCFIEALFHSFVMNLRLEKTGIEFLLNLVETSEIYKIAANLWNKTGTRCICTVSVA
jgi:hypothetical protein